MAVCHPPIHPFFKDMPIRDIDKNQPLQIALVGEAKSGKSAYVLRYTTCQFHRDTYQPTNGVVTTAASIWVSSRERITRLNILLHDVGSQTSTAVVESVLRQSNVALVFTNGSVEGQFGSVNKWLDICDKHKLPTIIVSSFSDICTYTRRGKKMSPGTRLLVHYMWKQPPTNTPRMGVTVSTLGMYDLGKPVIYAARKYYGDMNLYQHEVLHPVELIGVQPRL